MASGSIRSELFATTRGRRACDSSRGPIRGRTTQIRSYRGEVRRALATSVAVVLGGVLTVGCSGGQASDSPQSSAQHQATITTSGTTPLSWLSSTARPMNKLLNTYQNAILLATRVTSEVTAGVFFNHLASACAAMLKDADKAQRVPPAPSTALATSWQAMVTQTKAYALDCLTLTRTHSTADLNRWNSSLKTMDTANAALNSAVAIVRTAATAQAG
jgi:hypothetical protein